MANRHDNAPSRPAAKHLPREIDTNNRPDGFVCRLCSQLVPWKWLAAFDPVKVCISCK